MATKASSIKTQLARQAEKLKRRIDKSMEVAAKKFAQNVLKEGRRDIAGAGNFGTRWTQGFTAEITGSGKERKVTFHHAVPYWTVFQKGKVIRGKPLLLIPLPGVDPDERGDFFQTSRKGNLLLFKKVGKKDIQPLRVAKKSVRIPKKFHLLEIIKAESKTMGALFKLEMAKRA